MKTALLVLILLTCTRTPALADSTLAIWYDDIGHLERICSPWITAFSIVVTLQSDGTDVSYVEWSMPDLVELFPGLLLLAVTTPGDENCGPGGCLLGPGDFAIAFDACAAPVPRMEVARLVFLDLFGDIAFGPEGMIMTAASLPADAGMAPQFAGSPGFLDCDQTGHAAAAGGSPQLDPRCNGVIIPAGGLWLSPGYCVGMVNSSLGMVKSRY